MRIVQLTSAHPAGDTRIAQKEAASASAAGHDVTLIAPDFAATAPPDGVTWVRLPRPKGRFSRIILGSRRAAQAAAAQHPDLIQLHDPELLLWLPLMNRNARHVIYDMHEDLPAQILGKYWIPRPLRAAVASAAAWYLRGRLSQCSAVVHARQDTFAQGAPTRNVLVENFPSLAEFGIDAEQQHVERLHHADGEPFVIAYVGAMTPIRGLHELLDALDVLAERVDCRLALAGTFNPPSLQAELEARPGWRLVDFHGVLDRTQVTELLAHADVGIVTFLPSPNNVAGHPTKLFEYMAAGLPVVASDFGGWRAIVAENECGLLADPENPVAIAEAMETLARDPHMRRSMGESGRRAVIEKYNWEHEAGKLTALYRELETELD